MSLYTVAFSALLPYPSILPPLQKLIEKKRQHGSLKRNDPTTSCCVGFFGFGWTSYRLNCLPNFFCWERKCGASSIQHRIKTKPHSGQKNKLKKKKIQNAFLTFRVSQNSATLALDEHQWSHSKQKAVLDVNINARLSAHPNRPVGNDQNSPGLLGRSLNLSPVYLKSDLGKTQRSPEAMRRFKLRVLRVRLWKFMRVCQMSIYSSSPLETTVSDKTQLLLLRSSAKQALMR